MEQQQSVCRWTRAAAMIPCCLFPCRTKTMPCAPRSGASRSRARASALRHCARRVLPARATRRALATDGALPRRQRHFRRRASDDDQHRVVCNALAMRGGARHAGRVSLRAPARACCADKAAPWRPRDRGPKPPKPLAPPPPRPLPRRARRASPRLRVAPPRRARHGRRALAARRLAALRGRPGPSGRRAQWYALALGAHPAAGRRRRAWWRQRRAWRRRRRQHGPLAALGRHRL